MQSFWFFSYDIKDHISELTPLIWLDTFGYLWFGLVCKVRKVFRCFGRKVLPSQHNLFYGPLLARPHGIDTIGYVIFSSYLNYNNVYYYVLGWVLLVEHRPPVVSVVQDSEEL